MRRAGPFARLLAALLMMLAPLAARAQGTDGAAPPEPPPPAVLIADDVRITAARVLIARGNVEVLQGETRLTAQAITYDPDGETLAIEGPITLTDGAGIVIVADAAALDRDLRNGLLRSARMVLSEQVQLAAVQINRVDARYSQLYKAAVTSCQVCESGRPPLWQIRARRIVHDQLERQLYFEQAQFHIRGVPVLYLPRLRLPDPTLERATGFLIPSIRTTSQLSNGVKVPYFIRLGDHRDLTLTPYLSRETRTLEFRYRQAFRAGRIGISGALSRDSLMSGKDRWYLFGGGQFDLARGFRLDFDLQATSDTAYLVQYGYADVDRLDSSVSVSRTRRDEFIRAGVIGFRSLRAGESNSTLPSVVIDTVYERRLFPAALGGELRLAVASHAHYRASASTVPGEGRDVARLHGAAAYLHDWTFAGGLRAQGVLALNFDAFDTAQDADFAGSETALVPQAALALRYPLSKTAASGAVHVLEPALQLVWTGGRAAQVANDESTRVEFDEGNLYALSRFPAPDRREHGTALAMGASWARYDPDGWESHVTIGQIVRDAAVPDFSRSSGLSGAQSDVLLAGQIRTRQGLALAGRALLDARFDATKAELRGDWSNPRWTLGGSYLWLTEDAAEDRAQPVGELTLDGAYRFGGNWTVSSNWRYDVEGDRTARAGLGLGYDNECVSLNFRVERRFTASTSVEPETSFGFTVALRGFSANTPSGTESYTRSCS